MKRILLILSCFSWTLQAMDSERAGGQLTISGGSAFSPVPPSHTPLAEAAVDERLHVDRSYVCATCGKGFENALSLRTHRRIHVGVKKHICAECGRPFLRSEDLVIHERSHTGDRPYACPQCGESFTTDSNMRRHERTHMGKRPYACATCDKTFPRLDHLRRHERTHAHIKRALIK